MAKRYVVGDSLDPLIAIWHAILREPETLAGSYERLWNEQLDEPGEHFNRVRAEYNEHGGSARLLYLLARCVKNAPRWNKSGGFSQSADKRRKGMQPAKMRRNIDGCHELLGGKATAVAADAIDVLEDAGPSDLAYLDPPWQGTTEGSDTRYHQGFDRGRLEELLAALNEREVRWILSYDGRHGDKVYGPPLPAALVGQHFELAAGRSSQATLNGRTAETFESLYLSPGFSQKIEAEPQQLVAL